MSPRVPAVLLVCALLGGCGGDKSAADASAQGVDALPKPGEVSGSVTGMPNPGTASAPRQAAQAPAVIELPDQANDIADAGGESALQPPPEGGLPAASYDQAGPELASDPPADVPPPPTELPEPTPPQR